MRTHTLLVPPKMSDPDLTTTGMSLSDDDMVKERARVKSGTLRKVARLVLFSPDIPVEEKGHWSIQPLQNIKNKPVDVVADVRLSNDARMERRLFKYKTPGGGQWDSMVFCRVEEGKSPVTGQ